MWVTAACSAESFALASLAACASVAFKFAFFSAISFLTSLARSWQAAAQGSRDARTEHRTTEDANGKEQLGRLQTAATTPPQAPQEASPRPSACPGAGVSTHPRQPAPHGPSRQSRATRTGASPALRSAPLQAAPTARPGAVRPLGSALRARRGPAGARGYRPARARSASRPLAASPRSAPRRCVRPPVRGGSAGSKGSRGVLQVRRVEAPHLCTRDAARPPASCVSPRGGRAPQTGARAGSSVAPSAPAGR